MSPGEAAGAGRRRGRRRRQTDRRLPAAGEPPPPLEGRKPPAGGTPLKFRVVPGECATLLARGWHPVEKGRDPIYRLPPCPRALLAALHSGFSCRWGGGGPLLRPGDAPARPPALLTWWSWANWTPTVSPGPRLPPHFSPTRMFLLNLQGLAERPPPPRRLPRGLPNGTDAFYSSCEVPSLIPSLGRQPGPQEPESPGTSAQPSPSSSPPLLHLISSRGRNWAGEGRGRGEMLRPALGPLGLADGLSLGGRCTGV